jgi:hypothetical protein
MLALGWNAIGAGGADGVASGIFLIFIRGWSGLELSLTCRQSEIAEDLSDKERERKRKGQVDKQMPPLARCIQNAGSPHTIKRTNRGAA